LCHHHLCRWRPHLLHLHANTLREAGDSLFLECLLDTKGSCHIGHTDVHCHPDTGGANSQEDLKGCNSEQRRNARLKAERIEAFNHTGKLRNKAHLNLVYLTRRGWGGDWRWLKWRCVWRRRRSGARRS